MYLRPSALAQSTPSEFAEMSLQAALSTRVFTKSEDGQDQTVAVDVDLSVQIGGVRGLPRRHQQD